MLNVAATEDYVLGFEGGDQLGDHVGNVFPPFLLAVSIKSALADVVLKRALSIGKMCQLHWLDNAIDDHGGAQAGAQAQKEHFPSLVAPQGLHGGIIDDP